MDPEAPTHSEDHDQTSSFSKLTPERMEEMKKKYPDPYVSLDSLEQILVATNNIILAQIADAAKLRKENYDLKNKLDRQRENVDVAKKVMWLASHSRDVSGQFEAREWVDRY